MKKVLVLLMALCFLFAATTAYAADYAIAGGIPANGNGNGIVKTEVKVTGNQGHSYDYMLVVNGRVLNINKTKIFVDDEEIMVPVRDALKGLGFQVRWHGLNRTITAHQADVDYFVIEVDEDGFLIMKGTSYISLDLLEEIMKDEGFDIDIDVDEAMTMTKGNKNFTSVGVITITGGIDPMGQGGQGGGSDDPDEDSMTGFITDIFEGDDFDDLLEDLTEDEDELEALEDELDVMGLDNLEGAIELDEEVIFLVDEEDTEIELLDEAVAEFDDLEEGMWVKVIYNDTEVAEDTFAAEDVDEIEETTEGRVAEVLSKSDVKDALDLTTSELNSLEADLFMDDTEGGLLLDNDHFFLIDTDTEILDEEGADIDLDDLEDGRLVLVTYHGPKVENDPKTYVAKKVEVLSETKLGYITDILDMEDVEAAIDVDGDDLDDFEIEYDMGSWLGALELDDDLLFLVGEDSEIFDEDGQEIDFVDLEEGLLVLITHDFDDVEGDDDPVAFVAMKVEIMEETVEGTIVTVYGPDGDETAILVDVDGGEETLFLIGDDTDVDETDGDLEVGAEVEVVYFDELLDDTPDEYAAKEISVLL